MRRALLYMMFLPFVIQAQMIPANPIPTGAFREHSLDPFPRFDGDPPRVGDQSIHHSKWPIKIGDPLTKELMKSADFGDPIAQTAVGLSLVLGKGVPKDVSKGMDWLRRAAAGGSVTAEYCLGNLYSDGDSLPTDYAESARWMTTAANHGEVRAQVKLALLYVEGKGVERNYGKAISLLKQAAKKHFGPADQALGVMNELGWNKSGPDYHEALKWYERGSKEGSPESEYRIGMLYLDGRGVSKNVENALTHIRAAANLDVADAQFAMGMFAAHGTYLPKDEHIAFEWYTRALDNGSMLAAVNLAYMYEKGIGVVKNQQKGFELNLQAAKQGIAVAEANVGTYYARGLVVSKDMDKAKEWFQRASDHGYAVPADWMRAVANGAGREAVVTSQK